MQADWVRSRLRRRVLTTFPFSRLRAQDYRNRLAHHAGPAMAYPLLDEICSAFTTTGAMRLDGAGTALLFGILGDLSRICEKAHSVLAASEVSLIENEAALIASPALYRMGLAPLVLDLAEACLGLDCFYLGATLKCEKADGRVNGTRQWHMDIEDEKLFRILLYLAPVTADGGPFEFFPRAPSRAIKEQLNYRSGYVSETEIAGSAPRELVRQCTGIAGDAVIFDGAGVFHRGRRPVDRDRYSVTFAYCSRCPLELRSSARLPRRLHSAFLATLSARERQAIPPPRSF